MKFLVVLGLFLASQLALAKGLSNQTKRFLGEKDFFKLSSFFNSKDSARLRALTLREINRSPASIEEAQRIVKDSYAPENLTYINSLLKIERTAHSLGLEFTPETVIALQFSLIGELNEELAALSDKIKVIEDRGNIRDINIKELARQSTGGTGSIYDLVGQR